ncbi:hypothetical protein Ac2012v2_002576 [Leucoagaricus gongylophorus]
MSPPSPSLPQQGKNARNTRPVSALATSALVTPVSNSGNETCSVSVPNPSGRRAVLSTSPPPSPLPPPPPPQQQRTRARDLLRKHYGLGMRIPPSSGNMMDPMNMDSNVFDAKSYYEQLIMTSSLPTLLKREHDLITEIKELDSERQSLVYNHHHELVAASDTIAVMKNRAESLDSDLDLLRAAFSEISRLVTEVSDTAESESAEGEKKEVILEF